MRKILLASTTAIGLAGLGGVAGAADLSTFQGPAFVEPVQAPSPWSGVIGLYAGYSWIDADDEDEGENGSDDHNFGLLGLHGAANVNFGDTGLQIGGVGESGYQPNEDEDTYGGTGVETHFYFRDPSAWALGIFTTVLFDQYDDDWNVHGAAGLDGALYFGPFTLAGQGGYIGSLDNDAGNNDNLDNAWFARLITRWFVNPDFKLQAEGGYFDGDIDGGENFDAWTAGAEAELRFSGTPASVFLAWDGIWGEHSEGGDTDKGNSQTITGGLRFTFGQDTLQDLDRNGPSWDTPDIIRMNGFVGEAL